MKPFKLYLKAPSDSFFLFGPRGTGKSTWLQSEIEAALYVDLLESDRFLELSAEPMSWWFFAMSCKFVCGK